MQQSVWVYKGGDLAAYGFGEGHPFGPDRHNAFHERLATLGLDGAIHFAEPRRASLQALELFHDAEYIERVRELSAAGSGWLDGGDTPVVPGIYEAAATVVGSTLDAVDAIVRGDCQRAFVPIAGLHHARRDAAAGFCVFNDCGVAIEYLRERYQIRRVAYVDIDAHHGDGVFYSFESDPDLIFADTHEDGRILYPGTGAESETGTGAAKGTKLNIALAPGDNDEKFLAAWERVEAYLDAAEPEFFIFQCGADSIGGDPITHLELSPKAHAHAARRLCRLADRHAGGRLLATGGGGYNRDNLAAGWTAVVQEFVTANGA